MARRKKNEKENRAIDLNGRLVIPSEMRAQLGLTIGSEVSFALEGQQIIIRKHNPGCIFCSGTEGLIIFEGKRICANCLDNLKKID